MVHPSLFLYFFRRLFFPHSYLIGGTIPTSVLVLVKTIFTPLVYIIYKIIYIYIYIHIYIYHTSCRIFLFDAAKMAVVGEQWLIRCRKLHMACWTLKMTTTCRSLLYTTPTGTPLRRTLSNTTASKPSENRFHSAYAMHTYMAGFRTGKHSKIDSHYPCKCYIYALFVLNTKESRNEYYASHYGSTYRTIHNF